VHAKYLQAKYEGHFDNDQAGIVDELYHPKIAKLLSSQLWMKGHFELAFEIAIHNCDDGGGACHKSLPPHL